MSDRIKLQEMLEALLGTRNVYYQPPASVMMQYPAIVYSRSKIDNIYAGNAVYRQHYAYELVVIDKDPDSELVEKVSRLQMCSFSRHYTADGLNHDVFTLYFK